MRTTDDQLPQFAHLDSEVVNAHVRRAQQMRSEHMAESLRGLAKRLFRRSERAGPGSRPLTLGRFARTG